MIRAIFFWESVYYVVHMEQVRSSVLFGGGYMGKNWLRTLVDNSGSVTVVDTDSDVATLASGFGTNFIQGDYSDESWRQENPAEVAFLESADLWCASVDAQFHQDIVRLAIENDIETLIVEKPLATSYDEVEALTTIADDSDTNIAIDFVETVNPAFVSVLDEMSDDFQLLEAHHWRGKNLLESGSNVGPIPYTYDDVVHDVSELQVAFNIDEFSVEEVEFTQWDEDSQKDVTANIHLSSPTGHVTLRGGFNERDQRRGFLWVGDDDDEAFYGNTLNRYFVRPQAYHIQSEDAVAAFKTAFQAGNLVSDSDIQSLANEYDSVECLYMESDERMSNLDTMFSRAVAGDPPVSISQACSIHRVIRDIYDKADFELEFSDD